MKTEIFGTFGPACAEEDILREMIAAGMTGMRLNLSHTTLVDSADYIIRYQRMAESCGVEPQILIDMKGPELRVGKLRESLELKKLTELSLYRQAGYDKLTNLSIYNSREDSQKLTGLSIYNSEKEGKLTDLSLYNSQEDGKLTDLSIYIPVPREVLDALDEGDELLLDDGKIKLSVVKVRQDKNDETIEAVVKVIQGGLLQSGKSIKIRDKFVNLPPLTHHDIENIKDAKKYGVTAVMQPFVLSGEDLRQVRAVLKEYGAEDVRIFAKIENRIGVEHIQDILLEADVIVIARGDLGNDMPLWELPRVQKEIEDACKKAGKQYIVVTQMLASMEEHPVPTRAEVSDIFHAVYHGAWGVMLTGETAVGKYPVEAIQYLTNTARGAAKYLENTKQEMKPAKK